jgi:pimeloyl-ACP methyl ester carboxylesterase
MATTYRLLQSGSKRLIESAAPNGYALEGDISLPRRPCIAAFRRQGPSPDLSAHMILYARMDKPSVRPQVKNHQVIYMPGGGGLEDSWMSDTSTNPAGPDEVLRDVTDRGVHRRRTLSIPTDYTWGNDELLDRVDSMFAYAEANYGFTPPYHLVGASMGTLCCLNWAVRNPTLTKSVSLLLPLVNPRLMDTDGRLTGTPPAHHTYSPPIDLPRTAYGGSAPPTAYNPLSRASDFTGIPIKMWASQDDEVCYLSEATSFASGSGATLHNMGTMGNTLIYGHSLSPGSGGTGHFTPSEVQDWMIANDA